MRVFLHSIYMPSALQLVRTLMKVRLKAWAVVVSVAVNCVPTDYISRASGELNNPAYAYVCACPSLMQWPSPP